MIFSWVGGGKWVLGVDSGGRKWDLGVGNRVLGVRKWGSGGQVSGGGPKIMTSGGENYDPGMKIMTLRYENYDLVASKLGWETQDPGGGNRWFGVPGMGSGGGLSRVYVRYG